MSLFRPFADPAEGRCDATARKRFAAGAVFACLAFVAAVRLHTWNEPLERDLAAYLVVGNELLHGKRLYAEIWDHKPPAVHFAYAAAIAMFGYGPKAVYVLGVFTSGLTILGVYIAGRELGANRMSGVFASLAFATICSDLGLEANQPNVEAFMNACGIWFVALLLIGIRIETSWGWGVALGSMGAATTLFKQAALPLVAVAGLCYFIFPRSSGEPRHPWRLWKGMLAAVAVCGGAWLAVCLWYRARGDWVYFYDAVVRYNRYYAGSLSTSLYEGMRLGKLFPPILWFCTPLIVLSGVWCCAAAIEKEWHKLMVWGGAALGTWLTICLPAHFFPHYYQLWLPLLAVGAGAGLARLLVFANNARGRRRAVGRLAAAGLAVLAFGVVIDHELRGLRTPAGEWPLAKYASEGKLFKEIPVIARWVDSSLEPAEGFFQWGYDPGLYFYSGRRPLTTVISCHPLIGGPLADELEALTLRQLQVGRPRLVAISRYVFGAGYQSPSLAWIVGNYHVMPRAPAFQYYAIFERN